MNPDHQVSDHFADISKMVERRLTSEEKKSLKNPDVLRDRKP